MGFGTNFNPIYNIIQIDSFYILEYIQSCCSYLRPFVMNSNIIRLYFWGVWAITVLSSSISFADLNASEVLNEIIELRDDGSSSMSMVKLQIRISEAPLSEQKEFHLLAWEKVKRMPYPLIGVDTETKRHLIIEQQLAYTYIVNAVAKVLDKKKAFEFCVMAYLERETPDGLTEFLNTLELNQLYGEHTLPVLLELYNEQVDIRLLYGGNPNGFSCGTCGCLLYTSDAADE